MTFIEIDDGYYIKAEAVVVVKRISKNRALLCDPSVVEMRG